MPDLTDQMVDAPTPRPWGVGARGGQLRQMNPRMLLQLLQAKQQQQQIAQKMNAMKQMAMQKQQAENQKIAMLSPEEQADARMFGIKYVADKRRQAQSSQDIEGRSQREMMAKRMLGQQDQMAKREEAKRMLEQMMGGLNARTPVQAPGMPGMPAPPPRRVIPDVEAQQIFDAQKKSGVAPQLPPGFVLQSTLDRERQMAQKATSDENKARLAKEQEQAFLDWASRGASSNEMDKALSLIKTGVKPGAAINQIESARSSKRKEEISRKDKERREAKTDQGKKDSEVNKLMSAIAKLEKENAGKVPVKGMIPGKNAQEDDPDNPGKKRDKMVHKLNQAQRDINDLEIKRMKEKLEELGGGAKNDRHRELLEKFTEDPDQLSGAEQAELDKYEGIGDTSYRDDGGYQSVEGPDGGMQMPKRAGA